MRKMYPSLHRYQRRRQTERFIPDGSEEIEPKKYDKELKHSATQCLSTMYIRKLNNVETAFLHMD